MTTDTKAVARWDIESQDGRDCLHLSREDGDYVLFTDHERVVGELRAEIDSLLEVIAPFGHFALVRSALGRTAPKGGTVYSVVTALGDAEISAEDFEAAFNAIARNTNDAMEKGNV